MKLNLKAFALAAGIVWGGATFVIGLWATFYAPAGHIVAFAGQFYLGYDAGVVGSLIGLVWGFLDAAIGAVIFIWLYNLLVDKFAKA